MAGADEIVCRDLVELVTDYLEGALGPITHGRIEQHLVMCDGCQDYVAQMQRTATILGDVGASGLSDDRRRELLDVFRGWAERGSG